MANITFNSVDLSIYDLVTPKVSGVHDLVADERSRVWIPGRDLPADALNRRSLGLMKFGCVVYSETSHADLVSKLKVLKGLTSPALGFCSFAITDRSGEQTWARSLGFGINIDQLPYLTDMVEFDWSLERYPYWEDATEQTATDPASINNTGDLPTFPVYTLTMLDDIVGGLWFTVNDKTWEYSGDVETDDVLTVVTDLPKPYLNGALDFANTPITVQYPELVTGSNAVSKSSVDFTLKVDYRRRFE